MEETKKGLILCVDDEPIVLEAMARILKSGGYETVCADDGVTGFAAFEKHKKSLWGILTDARMREMDGLQLAERVRETGVDIPIILVTAYMADGMVSDDKERVTVEDYHAAGINGHVEKPFQRDQLLTAAKITFDPYGRRKLPEKQEAQTDATGG